MERRAMTHQQVMELLPHRPPMLLVDEVTALEPLCSIQTRLRIDPAWEIFKGHFPGDPVFPGALSVEAAAQAVDLLVMSAPKYAGKTPLFLGINNVRFRRKILPGEVLECRAALRSEREDKAILTCEAEGYVNGELAMSGEITIAMR